MSLSRFSKLGFGRSWLGMGRVAIAVRLLGATSNPEYISHVWPGLHLIGNLD